MTVVDLGVDRSTVAARLPLVRNAAIAARLDLDDVHAAVRRLRLGTSIPPALRAELERATGRVVELDAELETLEIRQLAGG